MRHVELYCCCLMLAMRFHTAGDEFEGAVVSDYFHEWSAVYYPQLYSTDVKVYWHFVVVLYGQVWLFVYHCIQAILW